jgi:chaperone modulatory protein CbpM
MIDLSALLEAVAGLHEAELRQWIEQDWVRPGGTPAAPLFQEIDVARVRLILDLRQDLAVNDEAMPVVLSLVDQLYRERARLRRLCRAMGRAAPPDILTRMAALLDEE